MTSPLIVVKVGGSLYDLPNLAQRLRHFLTGLDDCTVVLFPGGGATADAIRILDKAQQLGDEASHWLAMQALSINSRFLTHLLPEAALVSWPMPRVDRRTTILDPYPFFQADEQRPGCLPHRWDVTSDSLAVRAADLLGAAELVLLKSVGWERSDDWLAAARSQVVDSFFAEALTRLTRTLSVRVVNLRSEPPLGRG